MILNFHKIASGFSSEKYGMHTTQRAFTLIECLLALLITAILIAISYPLYSSYQAHAKRNAAEMALMQLSSKMEVYFEKNNTYSGATLDNLHATHLTDGISYQLLLAQTDHSYAIQAIPTGIQAKRDAQCGVLSLNDKNEKGISGSASVAACWNEDNG